MATKRKKKQNLRVIKSKQTKVAARSSRNKSRAKTVHQTNGDLLKETYSLAIVFLGIFLLVALISSYQNVKDNAMGITGEGVASALLGYFGLPSFLIPFLAFLGAYSIWNYRSDSHKNTKTKILPSLIGIVFFSLSCSTIAAIISNAGGQIGDTFSSLLIGYLSWFGALLFSFFTALISFLFATRISTSIFFGFSSKFLKFSNTILKESFDYVSAFTRFAGSVILGFISFDKGIKYKDENDLNSTQNLDNDSTDWSIDYNSLTEHTKRSSSKSKKVQTKSSLIKSSIDTDGATKELKAYKPLIKRTEFDTKSKIKLKVKKSSSNFNFKNYKLPSYDFLVKSEVDTTSNLQDKDLIKNSEVLEVALQNFKVTGKVVEVHPGPVVTLYEFVPGPGIKVQRVINLADDLALALKVSSVRVYAPVPGKGTVGIEVPNKQRDIVRLREVIDSDNYKSSESSLLLALGKDTYGRPFVADLARMPHLLIAGATGTGKSVCINSLLLSLLYRNSPETLKLIMIDPKMLELSTYEEIPHLSSPVVTNPKHAKAVLWWAVEEMERRYSLMKKYNVRDVAMFNQRITKQDKDGVVELQEKDVIASKDGLDRRAVSIDDNVEINQTLPRIVIVVDELADLMLTVGRDIEELLTRLAQKARAAGIHLILATQRPSVNVITGLIKANFPARISFKVTSKIDSRTILDASGAERLLGRGDLLFSSPSIGRTLRLHSPYVSDSEVADVVDHIKSQGEPCYDKNIEDTINKLDNSESNSTRDLEYDEYYQQAVQLVIDKGQASTSMVQRAFRIGYNRAARILETMEAEGVVGPADGSRPRQVLVLDTI